MTTAIPNTQSEETALHECLGRSPLVPSRIVRLDRERLASSTSYETSLLKATLEDGREFKVFLKDYAHSMRPKDDPEQRCEREMRFYRDLAPAGELGTPKYFGSVWEPQRGRRWLLMEYVQGTPVRYCAFESWYLATAWLGRLHGHFARQLDRLRTCGFLAHHDERFFTSKAENSLAAVRRNWPALADQLSESLRDYHRVVRTMVDQPRTLVHGGFRPINVLINIQGDPDRTCTIDWEEAGVGSPLSDLAYFVDGFKAERLAQLLDAYRDGAGPYGLTLPPEEQMIHVINCFRLHKLVHSLRKYMEWGIEDERVVRLVGEVAQYAREARA